jgi:protocatechuate 3,4-dioxygenase beta subunit
MYQSTKLKVLSILITSFLSISCNGQSQNALIQKLVNETPSDKYGIPKVINSTDTSAGWNQNGQKLLLTGIVYQLDGKTPASNIIIYYYQTNVDGKYVHKPNEPKSLPPNSQGQTHGYIRGWVKTNKDGKYFIYTVRPGAYATQDEPAHIHPTIWEPKMRKSYYIDDFVFDDDILLTTTKRKKMENRGGSGVLRLVKKGNLVIGERNIILGLNIPNYPQTKSEFITSGKHIGEDIISFTPYHAWGPDRDTKTCPICKYGWYNGVLYFVGNKPNWAEIKQWLTFLETESIKRSQYLKVYFIYGNTKNYQKSVRASELTRLGIELKLEKIALTFVPSFADTESEIHLNRINQNVENTFLLYKRSRVIDKYINIKPTSTNLKLISNSLNRSANEYFKLPK